MIYIDPPYNTGNDFVYKDDYKSSLINYERITGQRDAEGLVTTTDRENMGRLHSEWLNMVYPRLFAASELLKNDGVIAISVDDREYKNMNTVCCDVFGEENIVGTLVWKNATDNNPTNISVEHEYIIVVAKNKASLPKEWKSEASVVKDVLIKIGDDLSAKYDADALESAYNEWYREHRTELWPLDRYKYIDSDGVYTGSQSVHNPGREGYRYDVIHPVTGKATKQPLMGYRFPKETMSQLLADGRILFGENEDKIIELKVYAKDYREKLPSLIEIDGRLGAYDLKDDFPEAARAFTNPKPVQLISLLTSYIATDDNDLILDFFAGSGTTGRAIWELSKNAQHRRFILVQLPEPLHPSVAAQKTASDFCDILKRPRTIAELTKERLRRAGEKLRAEHPTLDTGFRVYKLATSNLKPWNPDPDDLQASLLDAVENILPGRTANDLLVELLLKTGIDLCLPSEERVIAGATVHALGSGVLMVCLADIGPDTVEALGQGICDWRTAMDPPRATTFYFRDTGFADAATKANLAAIIRQRLDKQVEKLASL